MDILHQRGQHGALPDLLRRGGVGDIEDDDT